MSSDEDEVDIFKEPDDYYEAEKPPTFVKHQTSDGKTLTLRLVGHNPLWVSFALLTGKGSR